MNKFYVDDSPIQNGKFLIRCECDRITYTIGSFNVLGARLLGLSWSDYLRLCRDEFGAEIVGKNNYYPVAYFSSKEAAEPLVKLLNERLSKVINNVKKEEKQKAPQVVHRVSLITTKDLA